MPAFQVLRPRSLDEALAMLRDYEPGAAKIVAGGTDLIPNLQMKLFSPRALLDLKALSGSALRGIAWSDRDGLRIGALTTLTEIHESPVVREKFPVLASAVKTIAGPLQRNMGTLGGNLCLETRCVWYNQSYFWRKALGGCLKKDGHVCHVAPGGKFCWAVWSGDSAPALLALDAQVEIAASGAKRLPLSKFYLNDGMNRMALGHDELLTAVVIPARMAGRRGSYRKLRLRNSIDYPLAGVAVTMDVRQGLCHDARIALTAVNPAPLLVSEAAEWLVGQPYSIELVERIAHQAIRTAKPLTTSASTPVYRRDMVRLFTRQALQAAWHDGQNR